MPRIGRALRIAAALALCGVAAAEPVDTAAPVIAAGREADVVLLGEVHDNAEHHALQAEVIAALAPAAVVFEMLDAEQAMTANDGTVSGRALGNALGWEARGWPDFALYAPLFEAAGDARIYGAALPGATIAAVMETGLPGEFRGDAAAYGLDRPLEAPEQEAREAGQMTAHCDALPEAMLPAMVAAQRLKDATLAHVARQAHTETGGPVVIVTGNGHARRDWGVPRYLGRAAPQLAVLSFGQIEGANAGDAPPFDLWRVSAAPERGDPCAVFRQG